MANQSKGAENIGQLLKCRAREFYYWIFPKRIILPDSAKKVADSIYTQWPLDWDKVVFHYGLPWVLSHTNQVGVTSPGTWDSDKIHIYIKKTAWDPHSPEGLGLIIHECFHAIQFRQVGKGRGIGFFRGLMIPYLSCYFVRGRLREHYLEAPAYAKEDKFMAWYKDFASEEALHKVSFLNEPLDHLMRKCPELRAIDKKVRYGHILLNSTPGMLTMKYFRRKLQRKVIARGEGLRLNQILSAPFLLFVISLSRVASIVWAVIWNFIILCICLAVTILKPIIEVLFLLADGLVWGAGYLASALNWAIDKFKRLLGPSGIPLKME